MGFTGRGIVLREVGVDEDVVELDTLSLECLQNKVMYGPEGILGEGSSSRPS